MNQSKTLAAHQKNRKRSHFRRFPIKRIFKSKVRNSRLSHSGFASMKSNLIRRAQFRPNWRTTISAQKHGLPVGILHRLFQSGFLPGRLPDGLPFFVQSRVRYVWEPSLLPKWMLRRSPWAAQGSQRGSPDDQAVSQWYTDKSRVM